MITLAQIHTIGLISNKGNSPTQAERLTPTAIPEISINGSLNRERNLNTLYAPKMIYKKLELRIWYI